MPTTEQTPAKPARRSYCFNCGADLGPWDRFCSPGDDCGAQECVRAAQDSAREEREEAHERLDRDMGW